MKFMLLQHLSEEKAQHCVALWFSLPVGVLHRQRYKVRCERRGHHSRAGCPGHERSFGRESLLCVGDEGLKRSQGSTGRRELGEAMCEGNNLSALADLEGEGSELGCVHSGEHKALDVGVEGAEDAAIGIQNTAPPRLFLELEESSSALSASSPAEPAVGLCKVKAAGAASSRCHGNPDSISSAGTRTAALHPRTGCSFLLRQRDCDGSSILICAGDHSACCQPFSDSNTLLNCIVLYLLCLSGRALLNGHPLEYFRILQHFPFFTLPPCCHPPSLSCCMGIGLAAKSRGCT